MLKRTMTYQDFDGNERTETFYFNLTKAEVAKLELSSEGGLEQAVKRIVEKQDGKRIMEFMENLILMSYGEKSLDGREFVKNDKIRESFRNTEAYSDLFCELCTDADKASKFFGEVIPKAPVTQATPATV